MRVSRIAAMILAAAAINAQQAPRPSTGGVNFYSLEKEAALGKQLDAEFRRSTSPIGSPAVQEYVALLGQRIAAQIPEAKFPFTFSVIAADPCRTVHEPVALPGGYVFVPAALIAASHDEAELAGMLTHAMEHIAQRDWTRQATRGQLVNTAGSAPALPVVWAGGCADGSPGMPPPPGMLAFLRSYEMKADALAVQDMARAGFDPAALLQYVERVQPQGPVSVARVFSPLPDLKQRAASMRRLIEKMPQATYSASSDEFPAMQREIERLTEPKAPAEDAPSLIRRDPKR